MAVSNLEILNKEGLTHPPMCAKPSPAAAPAAAPTAAPVPAAALVQAARPLALLPLPGAAAKRKRATTAARAHGLGPAQHALRLVAEAAARGDPSLSAAKACAQAGCPSYESTLKRRIRAMRELPDAAARLACAGAYAFPQRGCPDFAAQVLFTPTEEKLFVRSLRYWQFLGWPENHASLGDAMRGAATDMGRTNALNGGADFVCGTPFVF